MRVKRSTSLALALGLLAGIIADALLRQSASRPYPVAESPPAPSEKGATAEPREVQTRVRLEETPPRPKEARPPKPVAGSQASLPMRGASASVAARGAGPTPTPAPAAAHGPMPEEVPATASVVERGQRWLEGKEEGTFPVIVAHYWDTVGFSAYVQGIRRLGGRFLIRDLDARQLTAEIDVEGDQLLPVPWRQLGGLSPRSRDLSDELAFSRFLRKAWAMYGQARYSAVLLLPVSVDAVVIGGIEEALRGMNRSPPDFVVIEGRYRQSGDDLLLDIVEARARSGSVVPLRLIVNLTAASRAGRI